MAIPQESSCQQNCWRDCEWRSDELYATELPDGIKLTRYDAKPAAQMEVAEQVMRDRRTLLKQLAGN